MIWYDSIFKPSPILLRNGDHLVFTQPPVKYPIEYRFQGNINLIHLVNDAQKDGTLAFIAVTPDNVYVGFSKNLELPQSTITAQMPILLTGCGAYNIFSVEKQETADAMQLVKDAVDKHKAKVRKLARKIRKQNSSNKPSTKVMTY